MNVPDSCQEWHEAMARGEDERHVLANIEGDQCVPDDVAQEFFRRLAGTVPWADTEDAWQKAKSVIWEADGPELFYCTGNEVPPGQMTNLLRFRPVHEWDRLLQDVDPDRAERLNRSFGISPSANWPADLTLEQREAVCADLQISYPTGHLNGITWVTDNDAVPDTRSDVRETLRCLGLPHFEGHAWVLVLRYNRSDMDSTLHVPRSLDAVDSWPFDLQADCDASFGMTKPTPEAAARVPGYPEAVHRSKRIDLRQMELLSIDGDTH